MRIAAKSKQAGDIMHNSVLQSDLMFVPDEKVNNLRNNLYINPAMSNYLLFKVCLILKFSFLPSTYAWTVKLRLHALEAFFAMF